MGIVPMFWGFVDTAPAFSHNGNDTVDGGNLARPKVPELQ